MKVKILSIAIMIISLSAPAFAETLILKDGRKVTGAIISEEKYRVKINVNGVPYTYYRDQIYKIEGRTRSPGAPIPLADLVDKSLKGVEDISDSKQDLILRLVNANGTRQSIQTIFRQMLADMAPEQRETFKRIFNADEVIVRLIPVYDKYYSEAELSELIKFYASPIGQKLIKSTPEVMREAMDVTITYFQERSPKGNN